MNDEKTITHTISMPEMRLRIGSRYVLGGPVHVAGLIHFTFDDHNEITREFESPEHYLSLVDDIKETRKHAHDVLDKMLDVYVGVVKAKEAR